MMARELGVWKAEDCALVLIDYQHEMFEVIRSETNADMTAPSARPPARWRAPRLRAAVPQTWCRRRRPRWSRPVGDLAVREQVVGVLVVPLDAGHFAWEQAAGDHGRLVVGWVNGGYRRVRPR